MYMYIYIRLRPGRDNLSPGTAIGAAASKKVSDMHAAICILHSIRIGVYIYIYMYIYICIYVCMYVYIYNFVSVYVCAYIYIYI